MIRVSKFIEKISQSMDEKRSILCIGLDPALPEQRSQNIIPSRYIRKYRTSEAKLHFCLDIIEQTKNSSAAFKPNQQYVMDFSTKQHQRMTRAIRKAGAISILDYKLNDIGDTIESALFYIYKWGYDATTFNPFLGNLERTVQIAHSYTPSMGLIVLTLTSNIEAVRYQKEANIADKPLFLSVAEDVKRFGADGCVIGATGHVTIEDITAIREIVGNKKLLLIPGIGTQKGDPEKVIRNGGNKILINVSRSIIYSETPSKMAEEYCFMFNKMRI